MSNKDAEKEEMKDETHEEEDTEQDEQDAENENDIVYAGELLDKFSARSKMIHRSFKKYEKLKEWEVDLLTGRGTLFPLHLLEQIGLMHNLLMPQYGADVEFSVRAKNAGYKLKINKDIKV